MQRIKTFVRNDFLVRFFLFDNNHYFHSMKLIVAIAVLFFLIACGAGKSSKGKNANSSSHSSFFNLAHFYSESEQNLSFPIWFNDSIIESEGVFEITRSIYDDTTIVPEEQTLKKRIVYVFSSKGHLSSMNVSNHYDNKVISSVKVYFETFNEQTGYSRTRVNDNSDYNHEEFPFVTYLMDEKTENYTSFIATETSNKLFIVPNEKLWRALIIDTLLHPQETDIVIYGSYQQPEKKYQVRNLVEEFNVRKYRYKWLMLSEINWKDDPFKINRAYKYSKSGECIGFVESIFGLEKYVSAMHYDFHLKKKLPQKVVKKLFRNNEPVILSVEVFSYKFLGSDKK